MLRREGCAVDQAFPGGHARQHAILGLVHSPDNNSRSVAATPAVSRSESGTTHHAVIEGGKFAQAADGYDRDRVLN